MSSKDNLKDTFISILNSIGILILYTIVSSILTVILLSFMMDNIKTVDDIMQNSSLMFYSVVVVSPLSSLLTYLIYRSIVKNKNVLLFKKFTAKDALKSFGYASLPFVFSIVLGLLIQKSGGNDVSNDTTKAILSMSLPAKILTAVIVAPISEEIVFRGLLFNAFNQNEDSKVYPIMSGLLFGMLHVQTGQGLLQLLVPLIVTGFGGYIWAKLYQKEKNLNLTILSHMIYNGTIVLVSIL